MPSSLSDTYLCNDDSCMVQGGMMSREVGRWGHPIISTSWQVKVEEGRSVWLSNQPDAGQ